MRSFAWDDRGLQRTNPVYALRAILRDLEPHFLQNWEHTATLLGRTLHELAAEGVHLPPALIEDLKHSGYLPAAFPVPPAPPPPRVLGLVVKDGRDGLVLPLHAQEASGEGWPIDETLPFRAGPVLDLLVRLVRGAGFPTAGLLPERLAFAFANPLGHWAYGNSMAVAAVLAVLDALDGRRAELLRSACAVVEPTDGDNLGSVCYIRPKLEAVRREYGGGSLLIAPPQCPELDEFRTHFPIIWEVADCRQLAARLAEAGLLQPLLEKVRLRRVELQRIHDRLRHLVQVTHAYAEAGDLGRRLQDCEPSEPVPLHLWDAIHGLEAEAARHQGRFLEAGVRGQAIHQRVQDRGPFTSHDEQAEAAAAYAAALFDLHDFARIPELLQPWAHVAQEDPQRLRPQTRVEVLNTLGRALVILERDGWREHFEHSRQLQERVDPASIPRTLGYLAHGLLRSGDLGAARRLLEGLGPLSAVPGISGRILQFLRADLARRDGEAWTADGDMDRACPGRDIPGHPFAFYCQARARHRACPDAPPRLQQAADFLHADAAGHPHNLCSLFAACLDLFAAALGDDRAGWQKAADAIRAFLGTLGSGPLHAHYAPALDSLGATPERAVAEHFLRLIPYL